jgi:hypothetical protein
MLSRKFLLVHGRMRPRKTDEVADRIKTEAKVRAEATETATLKLRPNAGAKGAPATAWGHRYRRSPRTRPDGVPNPARRRSELSPQGARTTVQVVVVGSSMRANHSPGASISAGVGSSRSLRHSWSRPSGPPRSTIPSTKRVPRS